MEPFIVKCYYFMLYNYIDASHHHSIFPTQGVYLYVCELYAGLRPAIIISCMHIYIQSAIATSNVAGRPTFV